MATMCASVLGPTLHPRSAEMSLDECTEAMLERLAAFHATAAAKKGLDAHIRGLDALAAHLKTPEHV